VVRVAYICYCLHYGGDRPRTLRCLIDAMDDAETVLSATVPWCWEAALHVACSGVTRVVAPSDVTDRLDCIRVLLNGGFDANAIVAQSGRTPLHCAFEHNAFNPQFWSAARVLELLVHEGANLFARDKSLHAILAAAAAAAAAFEAADGMQLPPVMQVHHFDYDDYRSELSYSLLFRADGCVQLPLGTLSIDHMYSLLKSVVAKRPFTIEALNENGMTPLAAACQMNAPVYVIEFLLLSHPTGLSDISGSQIGG